MGGKDEKQIGAGRAIPGMMTFSFHVHSEEEIKCYLYYMGGVMRFMSDDLLDVLPLLFKDSTVNQEFVNKQEAHRSGADSWAFLPGQTQLPDKTFASFFEFAKMY